MCGVGTSSQEALASGSEFEEARSHGTLSATTLELPGLPEEPEVKVHDGGASRQLTIDSYCHFGRAHQPQYHKSYDPPMTNEAGYCSVSGRYARVGSTLP